jgi:hypothetical protein
MSAKASKGTEELTLASLFALFAVERCWLASQLSQIAQLIRLQRFRLKVAAAIVRKVHEQKCNFCNL